MTKIPVSRTKIIPPRRRPELLERKRLLDLLFEALNSKLVLVSAPAGYGKTALLIDLCLQSEYKCCWLSLDELDRDPQRFLIYFIASIAERFPGVGIHTLENINSLTSFENEIERLAVTLVNEVFASIHEHFVLILDDFHILEGAQPIYDFVNRFIQLVDDNCHIVVSSRTLTTLANLPLMVAHDQVSGLSFSDLAFRVDEIQALNLQNNNTHISDEDAQKLIEETEGWITGLQISGMKISGKTQKSKKNIGVGLFDYLGQQVVDRQTPELREILLRTSIMGEFDADLCESVLSPFYEDKQNWDEIIRIIVKNNLFALPVGADGRSLRYHHLFRDYLERLMRKEKKDEIEPIMERLAIAYENIGDWNKAYYFYAQLSDSQKIVKYIFQSSEALIQDGGHQLILNWIEDLPDELKTSNDQISKLIERLNRAPLIQVGSNFLSNAGFVLKKVEEFGFSGKSDRNLWEEIPQVYIHVILEKTLNVPAYNSIVLSAQKVFANQTHGRVIILLVDNQPKIGDLHQIFAIKHLHGLTMVPISLSIMTQAGIEKNEFQVLKRQLDLYLGRSDLYDIKSAVSDILSFFGRSSLLANIEHQLKSGQPSLIFGLRKLGKSSVLLRLREQSDWIVASIDLQGYIGGLSYIFEEVLKSWVSLIQIRYPQLNVLLSDEKTSNQRRDLQALNFVPKTKELLKLLESQNGQQSGLLIFIDESDLLLEEDDYFIFSSILRSLIEDPTINNKVCILLAGLDPKVNQIDHLKGKRNPFYLFFKEISLEPLTQEEVISMIIAIGAQMGIEYTEEALRYLVVQGGGHPYITRQLCSYSIRKLNRPSTVNIDIATSATIEYLQFPRNYFAESLWNTNEEKQQGIEKIILCKLAEFEPQLEDNIYPDMQSFEERQNWKLALDRLKSQNIIQSSGDGIRITIPLFRSWIRRYILNVSS